MQLWYSATSPYVRKVVMAAKELGLDGRIENIASGPLGPSGAIAADNPLGKVPALRTDSGDVIIGSRVICEYLDSLHDGAKLFPSPGADRWRVLKVCELADGAMDAGILAIMETRRAADEQSPGWIEKQKAVVGLALDALEGEADALGQDADIATITVCCALGWLEFRNIVEDWRANRPALADWYAGFSARPSALATEPAD